jgi:L-ribulose-5-phosphate 3-epimerase
VKPGIFQGAFPAQLSLEECLKSAKVSGFEGFELSLETAEALLSEAYNEETESILAIQKSVGLLTPKPDGIRFESSPIEWMRIRPIASQLNLEIVSISTMQLFYYPLSSHIPAIRSRAIEIVKKMIDVVADLGGDLVLVAPGMVTSASAYQETWERTRDAIEEILPYAEEKRILLALENIWNKFLLSPLEFVRFIDDFQSSWIGAYFDVANIMPYGNPEQWIRCLGSRLKRVHFKDYRLDISGIDGFTHLLHGDVPWKKVRQALFDIQYDGWIIAEVTPYRSYPEQTIPDTYAAMQRIILSDDGHVFK